MAKGDPWVTLAAGPFPRRSLRRYRLKVSKGPDKGATALVDRVRFSIGALPSNDLVLKDRAVSGHHAELKVEENGVRLRDLGSKNGTFVGDVRLGEALLPPKARIVMGDTRIDLVPDAETVEVPAAASDRFGPLVGKTVVMRELFSELEKIAKSDATVLITGETGTGKEAVAEALVAASGRADGPLVVVDCGALAPSLVESQLFGHEKGAFTGATSAQAGAFERADGGTVLLDEIGELPLSLQPKLLRVLEAREVQRLGGTKRTKVDIRVLAATHRALDEQVNAGTFRADLYYRLSVLSVRLPPLRERADDVELLARHFLSRLDAGPGLLTDEVVARLRAYGWPGNVRELRNAVERLVLGADPLGGRIESTPRGEKLDLDTPFRVQKQRMVADFEQRYAKALLEFSPDNLSKAARKAGMDRMAVVKLLQRHGLLPE